MARQFSGLIARVRRADEPASIFKMAMEFPCVGKTSENSNEAESHELRTQAIRAFETEIAQREREKYIADYVQGEYPHGYLPPQKVVEALAAQRWFKCRALPIVQRVAL